MELAILPPAGVAALEAARGAEDAAGPSARRLAVARDGDAPGFEDFFAAEYARLLRALYLVTGSRHEAEELAQDTFVRALERWHLVARAENRAGYVYRMALNLYRSKLRRVTRAARRVVQPPPEADPFAAADDRDAIGRALAALPQGQREAVVMVEWLGLSDDEVGAMLGISPVTVRVRIHRARRTLRPLLAPHPEGDLAEAGAEEPS